jgi:hypothetical protein
MPLHIFRSYKYLQANTTLKPIYKYNASAMCYNDFLFENIRSWA